MEKWLEMRSHIHRFYKIFRGRPPRPPNERGGEPPSHTLPLPPRGFCRLVQDFGLQCPPATTSLGPALTPMPTKLTQRTNGPVNVRLIPEPCIRTKHTKTGKNKGQNDIDLQYAFTFIY